MTTEEAINFFRMLAEVNTEIEEDKESFTYQSALCAISALEKQIPKKSNGRECACCGGDVGIYQVRYCMCCGQALSWDSDSDD